MSYCKICGRPNCKEHTFLIGKTKDIKEFSGSSPPEIFVGRYNYPNVNIGILSPTEYGDTKILSSPEQWHEKQLNIQEIVSLRDRLIYGRTQGHIKKLYERFLGTMQEVALTHKSISTEFKLKKSIQVNKETDKWVPIIKNTAPVEKVVLQENPKIKPKIDYITGDTDVRSTDAILELDKAGISSTHIMKVLSAGLLGRKTGRKLVPTRWSITAVDDILSKNKLKKIRYYPQISDILIFHSEYLGNHYEFLLLPDRWSFEVIEIALANNGMWKDYESFFPRKRYADNVTGAYYANKLALCEWLEKKKRQASCLVLREIRKEYDAPLGVGILRQASRQAFKTKPERFDSLKDAFIKIQSRLKQNINNYVKESILLKEYKKQSRLDKWF